MKHATFAVAAALALSLTPAADVLDRGRIPADAHWVAHVDLDALKGSTFFRLLEEEMERDLEGGHADLSELFEGLDEFEAEFGIDPMDDVRSFTLYAPSVGTDEVVAMMVVSSRIEQAIERLQAQPGYRAVEAGGLRLHTWSNPDWPESESFYAYVHRLEGRDERVVLFSQESAPVLEGIRVLLGEKPSLVRAATPRITVRPQPGSFLFVATAEGIDRWGDLEAASEVAGLAQGAVFDLGEARGVLFAQLSVLTETDRDALDVADVVQGGLAIGRMALRNDSVPPILRDLVRAIRVAVRTNEVILTFEYESDALVRGLRALEGR